MSADELSRRLPHYNEFDGAKLAINMLLKEGRIAEEVREGQVVYVPIDRHHNLFSDDWELRIDALSEHLEAVTETLRRRFLEDQPDPLAAARTFAFKAPTQEVEKLQEEVFDFIRKKYRELEQLSSELDDSECETLSLYVGITPNPRSSND
jgi:hypothetical protein